MRNDIIKSNNGSMEPDRNDRNVLILDHHEATPIIQSAIGRKQGLIARLFPGPVQREQARHEATLVKLQDSSTEKLFELFCEMKRQGMEEIYRAAVQRRKASTRAEKVAYLAELMQQMVFKLNSSCALFARQMDFEYRRLDEIENPATREREQRRIDNMMNRHYEIIDALLDDFTEAANSASRE
jgi:hypothetical protein